MLGSSGVVNARSTLVLTPMIRGEPDMVGLFLGSPELLYLSSWISRTLVIYISLSEVYLPGKSVSCQIQGQSLERAHYRLCHSTMGFCGTVSGTYWLNKVIKFGGFLTVLGGEIENPDLQVEVWATPQNKKIVFSLQI